VAGMDKKGIRLIPAPTVLAGILRLPLRQGRACVGEEEAEGGLAPRLKSRDLDHDVGY
jgi:hypothetical protein